MRLVLIFMLINISAGELVGLILGRGGSRGVRLKNIQKVGRQTLLQRTIYTARLAGIKNIVVSTDHPLIALEALKSGVEIFHRSRVTATDVAPSIWGVQEFVEKRSKLSIVVLLQATSTFSHPSRIRDALKLIENFDCVFSVFRSFKLRWTEGLKGVAPLNFNVESRPRRQDWKGELLETGAFYVTRRHLIQRGYFQNNK